MRKFIDWLKSPLGIGMGTTVIGCLLTVRSCCDLLKDKPVLNTIVR